MGRVGGAEKGILFFGLCPLVFVQVFSLTQEKVDRRDEEVKISRIDINHCRIENIESFGRTLQEV